MLQKNSTLELFNKVETDKEVTINKFDGEYAQVTTTVNNDL